MENTEIKMQATITNLKERLINIRAGRANPSMLNGIMVSYYGTPTPIQSVANLTVPEAKELFVKPYDRSTLKDIERAINEANIGITPVNNGEMIILTVPDLTEDRRREYVKQAKSVGEEAKVALRNIRQDGKEEILNEELPEDIEKKNLDELQEFIIKYNKLVDDVVKEKEEELMKIQIYSIKKKRGITLKGKNIALIIFVTVLINAFVTLGIVMYFQNLNEESTHKIYKSYSGETSTQSNSGIAYMVETGIGTGVYEQASDNTWPTDP